MRSILTVASLSHLAEEQNGLCCLGRGLFEDVVNILYLDHGADARLQLKYTSLVSVSAKFWTKSVNFVLILQSNGLIIFVFLVSDVLEKLCLFSLIL
jgi:hypothetical protein